MTLEYPHPVTPWYVYEKDLPAGLSALRERAVMLNLFICTIEREATFAEDITIPLLIVPCCPMTLKFVHRDGLLLGYGHAPQP